jgi:hypothetical protein
LMLALKLDENKVLGLAGVGPKAMENIHEQIAVVEFPELPVEVPPEEGAQPVAETLSAVPAPEGAGPETELVAAEAASMVGVEEGEAVATPVGEAAEAAGAKPPRFRESDEEIEPENAKDGVSLDELFKLRPEIFHAAPAEEDDAERKKDKKKKKKGVELVLDEELGEVVGRKKHKRGVDDLDVEEE